MDEEKIISLSHIDVAALVSSGCDLNEILFAKLLFEKHFGTLFQYSKNMNISARNAIILTLYKKGIILDYSKFKKTNDPVDLILHQPKLMTFLFPKEEERLFAELHAAYPLKVPDARGQSYRYLSSADLTSKDAKDCKKRYLGYIKSNPERHKVVMKCLAAELWERKKQNSLSYMKDFAAWINSQFWSRYVEYIERAATRDYQAELKGEKTHTYGEQEF
jgi:hypothetical protein